MIGPGPIRRALRDAIEVWLLPFLLALLPWSLAFALIRRLARYPRLYWLGADLAWRAAAAYLPDADPVAFKQRYRLLRLVDQVDTFLMLLRGSGWVRRYIDIQGEWPPRGAASVILTYHWGAGSWIWRLLAERGIHAWFLARKAEAQDLGAGRLALWFGRLRVRAMRRSGSCGVLFTGGSAGQVRAALEAGQAVVGMLDLPARRGAQTLRLPLFGRSAELPVGLLRMALEARVPVTLFSLGLNFENGRRDLRIEVLPADSSLQGAMQSYVRHFDQRLSSAPQDWQLWCEAPGLFVAAPAEAVDQAL